jgi:predicted transposase/invertase (TIGR01784 family)
MANLIPPRTDLLFRHVFGDEENKEFLIAFLQAVLGLPPQALAQVALIDTHLDVVSHDHKEPVLDVRAQLATGEQIDVEIQLQVTRRLRPRIMYYTSRMLAGQLHQGDNYDALGRAITILIVGQDLSPDDGYHHRYLMCEPDTNKVFSDALEIDTLELQKVPQAWDGTQLWKWMKFIAARNEQELDMAAQLDPVVAKAASVVRRWSAEDMVRLRKEAQDKAEMDRINRIYDYIDDAREQGLEQGRQEERTRNIRQALAAGISIEQAASIFEVPVEEVKQVAEV